MTMLEITKAVRELISDPKRHCKFHLAHNAEGIICDPQGPDAVCFCPIGAVRKVTQGDAFPVIRFWAANFKDLLRPEGDGGYSGIGQFNDYSSHEYVIDHLDQMIARMEHA